MPKRWRTVRFGRSRSFRTAPRLPPVRRRGARPRGSCVRGSSGPGSTPSSTIQPSAPSSSVPPAGEGPVPLEESERLCEHILSLPIYPELRDDEVERVAEPCARSSEGRRSAPATARAPGGAACPGRRGRRTRHAREVEGNRSLQRLRRLRSRRAGARKRDQRGCGIQAPDDLQPDCRRAGLGRRALPLDRLAILLEQAQPAARRACSLRVRPALPGRAARSSSPRSTFPPRLPSSGSSGSTG